jgi:hypothetical protein
MERGYRRTTELRRAASLLYATMNRRSCLRNGGQEEWQWMLSFDLHTCETLLVIHKYTQRRRGKREKIGREEEINIKKHSLHIINSLFSDWHHPTLPEHPESSVFQPAWQSAYQGFSWFFHIDFGFDVFLLTSLSAHRAAGETGALGGAL